MNSSAISACAASSRMKRRTRMFVSTARMLFAHVAGDPLVHFFQRAALRRPVRENRAVDILGGIAPGAPDKHPIAVFFPFEKRARTNAQLPPDLGGNGGLTLRRDFRLRECHGDIVPR